MKCKFCDSDMEREDDFEYRHYWRRDKPYLRMSATYGCPGCGAVFRWVRGWPLQCIFDPQNPETDLVDTVMQDLLDLPERLDQEAAIHEESVEYRAAWLREAIRTRKARLEGLKRWPQYRESDVVKKEEQHLSELEEELKHLRE